MAIRVGGTEPSTYYVGGAEVSRIYRGSDLVWEPSGGPPVYDGIWFNCEGGTPGNALTTSDNYYDAPTLIEGTATYTASGYSGTGWTIPAESATHRVTWNRGAGAATGTHSIGFWFYPDAMPTTQTRLARLGGTGTVSGLVVSQNGTGVMEYLTGTTPEGGMAVTIPAAGVWYWITYWANLTTDEGELALYNAAGVEIDSAYRNGPGFPEATAYEINLGRVANSGNFGAARFDEIRWDDTQAARILPIM